MVAEKLSRSDRYRVICARLLKIIALQLTRTTPTMASRLSTFLLLTLSLVSLAICKDGKKSEETISIDVKPSGQITHETVKLVSTQSETTLISLSDKFDKLYTVALHCLLHTKYLLVGEWSEVYVHLCSCGWYQ